MTIELLSGELEAAFGRRREGRLRLFAVWVTQDGTWRARRGTLDSIPRGVASCWQVLAESAQAALEEAQRRHGQV